MSLPLLRLEPLCNERLIGLAGSTQRSIVVLGYWRMLTLTQSINLNHKSFFMKLHLRQRRRKAIPAQDYISPLVESAIHL